MTVTGSRMTTNRHRSQYGDKEDDFGDNLDCRVQVDVWMGEKKKLIYSAFAGSQTAPVAFPCVAGICLQSLRQP